METPKSNESNEALIAGLAQQQGIDVQRFLKGTSILEDLEQFDVDRERRDQKILDLFPGMGYEKELEITKEKAKADRIRMALLFYSHSQEQAQGQDNGMAA
jgi:hypothetical protein